MQEKYERRFLAGKEHPVPASVGPIIIPDPFREHARKFHFLGDLKPDSGGGAQV